MDQKHEKLIAELYWRNFQEPRKLELALRRCSQKFAIIFDYKDNIRLNDVISLRYGRKELVESYTDLSVPAFIEHKYSAKDNFKSLRWMIDRKVDLRDFRLKVDGVCDRGRVLQRILLMSEKAEIATYFLTKCKVKNTEVTDKKGHG